MANLDPLSTILSTFGLVFLAEIGDKSQLVCMTLAARYRYLPVLLGSITAFLILNTLAVLFGVGLATWIPDFVLAMLVAVLFAIFGIKSLRSIEGKDDCEAMEKPVHSIFIATFLMLFLAEMGDKTQLAVAGLAATMSPLAVWTGATLALILTSALGVMLGASLLRRIPVQRLHRISGIFFLVIAAFAAFKAFEILV